MKEPQAYWLNLFDKFGNNHVFKVHQYEYDAAQNRLTFYEYGGGFEEVIEEGKTRKRAIMNFVGTFRDVSGFVIEEVEDAEESKQEV